MTKDKGCIIVWGILLWISLTFSFIYVLPIHWSVYFNIDFNVYKYIIATAMVCIMLICLPDKESVTRLFLVFILYLVVFPIGIVFSCQNKEAVYFILISICISVVELLISRITSRRISVRIDKIRLSKVIIWLSVFIVLISVALMFRERGTPNISALNFTQTYEIRSSYEISSLVSELYKCSTKSLIPFLIAVCFIKKRYKEALFLLLIQLLFFLWLANKTTIFSIGILLLGYYLSKKKNGSLTVSKIGVCGVTILSLLEFIYEELPEEIARVTGWIYSLLIRRVVFEPAFLKYSYYDFFVTKWNPKSGMSGTMIAPVLTKLGMIPSNYDKSIPEIIGMRYLDGSYANTGMFGAELDNFGIIGIFLAALFLFIFLLGVKKCESRNGKIFTCCISIYTILGLADSGSIQLINFSPMLLVALILYFFDMDEENLVSLYRYKKRKFQIIRYER